MPKTKLNFHVDTDLLVASVAGIGGFLFMLVSYKDISPDARFIAGSVLIAGWLVAWCSKSPLGRL